MKENPDKSWRPVEIAAEFMHAGVDGAKDEFAKKVLAHGEIVDMRRAVEMDGPSFLHWVSSIGGCEVSDHVVCLMLNELHVSDRPLQVYYDFQAYIRKFVERRRDMAQPCMIQTFPAEYTPRIMDWLAEVRQ